MTTHGESLALKVSHLETQVLDKMVVHEGSGGLELGGHQGGEGSPSAAENKLCLNSSIILVAGGYHRCFGCDCVVKKCGLCLSRSARFSVEFRMARLE